MSDEGKEDLGKVLQLKSVPGGKTPLDPEEFRKFSEGLANFMINLMNSPGKRNYVFKVSWQCETIPNNQGGLDRALGPVHIIVDYILPTEQKPQ